jgi:predicted  nucleic acid-binding Zn-ribbon protein
MDQADDGWDEATVVLDAQKRMQVLQHYLGHIDKDEGARIAAVEAAASAEQAALQTEVSSLEQQIAALQKQRDEAQAAIAASKAHAEDGAKAVKLKANNKRQEVLTVAEKFKALVAFFAG